MPKVTAYWIVVSFNNDEEYGRQTNNCNKTKIHDERTNSYGFKECKKMHFVRYDKV